ncbi:MAG: DinB family protein [Calditrichia bacterium]
MSVIHPVIEQNRQFLSQGIAFLEALEDDQYILDNHEYFSSSIGKHMRHVLDHYRNFVSSINGQIDYDSRERDEKVESQRSLAIATCRDLYVALGRLTFPAGGIEASVNVRCNDTSDGKQLWSKSTFLRELQFLSGHTVHHYALISMILRVLKVKQPEGFGIAPSTLKHESSPERQCAQ